MGEPSWILGQFWVTWGSFKSTYWSLGNHGWVGETCTSTATRPESISFALGLGEEKGLP